MVDYHATEGRSWRLSLSSHGTKTTRLPTLGTMPAAAADEEPTLADAAIRATASQLVLALYGRISVGSLKPDGDRGLFDLLRDWDPDE